MPTTDSSGHKHVSEIVEELNGPNSPRMAIRMVWMRTRGGWAHMQVNVKNEQADVQEQGPSPHFFLNYHPNTILLHPQTASVDNAGVAKIRLVPELVIAARRNQPSREAFLAVERSLMLDRPLRHQDGQALLVARPRRGTETQGQHDEGSKKTVCCI